MAPDAGRMRSRRAGRKGRRADLGAQSNEEFFAIARVVRLKCSRKRESGPFCAFRPALGPFRAGVRERDFGGLPGFPLSLPSVPLRRDASVFACLKEKFPAQEIQILCPGNFIFRPGKFPLRHCAAGAGRHTEMRRTPHAKEWRRILSFPQPAGRGNGSALPWPHRPDGGGQGAGVRAGATRSPPRRASGRTSAPPARSATL